MTQIRLSNAQAEQLRQRYPHLKKYFPSNDEDFEKRRELVKHVILIKKTEERQEFRPIILLIPLALLVGLIFGFLVK